MKRIFLCGLVFNGFFLLAGCDYRTNEATSSAVTTRQVSIAGAPVHAKDYHLSSANETIQVSADIAH